MDLSKYAALFLAESREHLSSLQPAAAGVGARPGATEPVDGLFRSIHTIKGMARHDGLRRRRRAGPPRGEPARRAAARPGRGRHAGTFQLLFRAVDALGEAVEGGRRRGTGGRRRAARRALERATGGRGGRRHAGRCAPARRQGDAMRPRPPGAGGHPGGRRDARRSALLARAAGGGAGGVTALRPSLAQLEREDFDGRLTFRIERRPATTMAAAIRTRGRGRTRSLRGAAAPVEAGGTRRRRQIRVDLRRLDALMKQVGELVVAKNRLGVMAAGRDDPRSPS